MNSPIALDILETIPLVMRNLRKEVGNHRHPSLKIEEFRVMMFVGKNKGRDLSSAADHVGLSLPSVSKIVDSLIKKEFITRTESQIDRRHLTLDLTSKGQKNLKEATQSAEKFITRKVSRLAASEQKEIRHALTSLRSAFSWPGHERRRNK